MKIILIAEFGKYGGTKTYFFQLVKYLNKKKYNILVLLKKNIAREDVRKFLSKNKVNYKILPKEPKNFIYRCLDRLPFKIIHNIYFSIFVFPIIFKRKPELLIISAGTFYKFLNFFILPYKLIYVQHTIPNKKNLLIKHITQRFLNYYLTYSKIILTVSKFSQRKIREQFLKKKNKKNVHFIYNYLSNKKKFENPQKQASKLINILTVGHVVSYKNPKAWIEIAKEVLQETDNDKIKFQWIGDGPLFEECRRFTQNATNINFIGYQKNVDKYYHNAEIYLQPSKKENCSFSVINALKWKLPCVTSNKGALPELIVNKRNGYTINPNQMQKFVDKLIYLVNNEEIRNDMAKESLKLYKSYFCYNVWERKMDILISKVLQKNP